MSSLDKSGVLISQDEYQLFLDQQAQIIFLKQQLSELKRLIFGSKSERFVPVSDNQISLFSEENTAIDSIDTQNVNYTRKKLSTKQKPIRVKIPSHLPRVEEIIEPTRLVEGAKKIGEEITEQLEYNPAKVFVRKIIRPKYALPNEQGVIIGELPTLTLPKSNAGASMLAQILVSKFVDHLPFYRQRQIFRRQKLEISDSTLGGWFNATCDLLEPLYDCLTRRILACDYLQMDESPIGVQDSHKAGSLHTGYQWVIHAPVKGLVLFKYSPSRSAKLPNDLLTGFKGTLQTDGYKVYQNLKRHVNLLGCMAHARRYFEKALDNDHKRASYVLGEIQRLYTIERKIKEREPESKIINRYRAYFAHNILTEMKVWMEEQILLVLPKSAIGKAFAYTLKIWNNLIRYMEHPNYQIDNNRIENTIRPLALGRKNYLFAGSHKAAQRVAMMYSFFATCKINDIEPLEWLTNVLKVIPDHKANKLQELLPIK